MATEMPKKSGAESAGSSYDPIGKGNFLFAGNEDGFKAMEKFDATSGHFDGSVGTTDDPTYTKTTKLQRVLGGETVETFVKLPGFNGEGLSNAEYHKAAGGSDIPMTYG